jgi:predicted regulator of Ras-like GTPase activity (Roadblock/LC7/MglB family)
MGLTRKAKTMDYVAALRKVRGLQGVERAIIISTKGQILAAIGPELSEDAANNVANYCAEFLQMAHKFALLTQRGNLEPAGIGIPEHRRVRFIFIDHKTILIAVLNQHASMGLFYEDLFGYGLRGGPIFPWLPRNSEYT